MNHTVNMKGDPSGTLEVNLVSEFLNRKFIGENIVWLGFITAKNMRTDWTEIYWVYTLTDMIWQHDWHIFTSICHTHLNILLFAVSDVINSVLQRQTAFVSYYIGPIPQGW